MAIRKIIGKSPIKASYAYLIEKKRDGHEFTEEEVRNIVDSILDDEMPESQMAALIMAIFFKVPNISVNCRRINSTSLS